jgi:putative radical SAM enzyme (TIGR03279 family)
MKKSRGGIVARIEPDSPAAMTGLHVGDAILSINGHLLHDVIDYQFYAAEEELDLVVQRGKSPPFTVHIRRDYDQELGLEFADATFDGIRRCCNRCEFCFIQQMPPGLRKSLYVRDDDYRHSFLYGNFITLTNLNEDDWARIDEQCLSPLYVSVHSTDPQLRARIFGTQAAADILTQLERLANIGIEVHTQIVVTPGLNDGPALERTVHDLAALYPSVASIAIVPVGLTRYHSPGLRTLTPDEARRILEFVKPLQRRFRRELGVGLAYGSDELYLMAGWPIPSARAYDGFPQLANGVGLTRQLLDEWRRAKRRSLRTSWPYRKITLVCGMLIAPTLRILAIELAQLTGATVDAVAVTNDFFGPTVTVSGLLTAQDVMTALRGRDLGDLVVLPRVMFNASGEVTLDDCTRAGIEKELGVAVDVADRLGEVVQLRR